MPAKRNAFADETLDEEGKTNTHELAQFVIKNMGTPFLTKEQLSEIASSPETLESVQLNIAELTQSHRAQLLQLYQYHAEVFNENMVDKYLQVSPCTQDLDAEHIFALEGKLVASLQLQKREFMSVLERFRYFHVQSMIPLYKKRAELERQKGGDLRASFSTTFPQTIFAYRMMEDKGAQLRVAKFLILDDDNRREKMRIESRWSAAHIQPLIGEYTRNNEFAAEIRKLVQDTGSRDPRSRRP